MKRRDLLLGTGALLGASSLAPAFARTPLRQRQETAPPRLVLIDLVGGNDGLNTVVPHGDDAYYRARPTIGLRGEDVVEIDDYFGVHASLEGLARRVVEGRAGIIHGIGYPTPNLSHFKSRDVWDTARLEGRNSGPGWVGRLAADLHPGEPHPDRLIHVGKSLPYAMFSAEQPAVAFAATRDYRFVKRGNTLERVSEMDEQSSSRLDFLRGVMQDAKASSAAVRRAVEDHRPTVEYPNSELGRSLGMLAALIASPVQCEVLSVDHGGFDTHDNQLNRQRQALSALDAALEPFLTELASLPQAARTLVVITSEFGRRVAENGSGGTDHGTAAPAFVCGPAARGGQFGKACDLEDLDDRENLKFTTDFRRLWATAVGGLFGAEVRAVLGDRYTQLPLLTRA